MASRLFVRGIKRIPTVSSLATRKYVVPFRSGVFASSFGRPQNTGLQFKVVRAFSSVNETETKEAEFKESVSEPIKEAEFTESEPVSDTGVVTEGESPAEEKKSTLTENETVTGAAKSHTFQAETRQILDIVANSLYTEREVFLRELISNASDALEKARFLQTTTGIIEPDRPLEIRLYIDEDKNRIIIQDSGIGMSADELVGNLGTIARSGSKQWVKEVTSNPEGSVDTSNVIGQFGVGFYSTFMVGETVEVYSQPASADKGPAHRWISDGDGSYDLAEASGVQRGTKIIVNLKEDSREFAVRAMIEGVIKKYSNFVGFPIYLNDEKLNTVDAIWFKQKGDVTDEQHVEFYRYVANAYDTPTYRLHFNADAPIDIHALFYFPERHMEKYGMGRLDPGVSLYSRKVLIQAKSKSILPDWLRFAKGVVDSQDIPLNISRENMQDSALISRLNTVLTRRIIKFLETEAKKSPTRYNRWFAEFGSFIKEGAVTDMQHKTQIAALLRFESSELSAKGKTKNISLDEYVASMPMEQKEIYYLVSSNREYALASPYYESFQKDGTQVLFLYNHIDDFVMKNLQEYNKRKLVSIETSGMAKKQKKDAEEDLDDDPELKVDEGELVKYLQATLGDKVSEVKTTNRLTSTPAIIVDHESAAVRRMMMYVDSNASPQPLPKQKMEVNPKHPIITKLFHIRNDRPEVAKEVSQQIFDNALIAADVMDSPRSMLPRLNSLLARALEAEEKKA